MAESNTTAVALRNVIVADVLISKSPGLVICKLNVSPSSPYTCAQVTHLVPYAFFAKIAASFNAISRTDPSMSDASLSLQSFMGTMFRVVAQLAANIHKIINITFIVFVLA